MSKRRVLCKFFVHGACLKGENCEFSHDWKDPPNNICTFYQKGVCAYGSRCRYEHVKVSRLQPPASASSGTSAYPCQYPVSSPVSVAHCSGIELGGSSSNLGISAEVSPANESLIPPSKPAWAEKPVRNDSLGDYEIGESRSQNPADRSICPFASAGSCPHGEKCPYIHGDLCRICGKNCLHPFRPQEREEHIKSCEKRQKHLEALKHSQEIECSVCLERVLLKPTAAERKFGILSECDHPFCISCIRNWRNSSPASGMDVNSTLRACPICRKLSYFVIPSVIWYSTKEEKQEIVDNYKAKLRSIDCKHFDFGNGTCPFGSSCFYKHAVKPGSYMWNATFMPNLSSSSFRDLDEIEYSSDVWVVNRLRLMVERLYTPQSSIGREELENLNIDDLENNVAEALAFLLILENSGDTSNDEE